MDKKPHWPHTCPNCRFMWQTNEEGKPVDWYLCQSPDGDVAFMVRKRGIDVDDEDSICLEDVYGSVPKIWKKLFIAAQLMGLTQK